MPMQTWPMHILFTDQTALLQLPRTVTNDDDDDKRMTKRRKKEVNGGGEKKRIDTL